MVDALQHAMSLLCSSSKLDRDKGVVELEKFLQTYGTFYNTESPKKCLETHLITALSDLSDCWEIKYGCLIAAKSLIPYMISDEINDSQFLCRIKTLGLKLLTDVEPRVRLAAGEVLGVLCQRIGCEIYADVKDAIVKNVNNNLDKVIDSDDCSSKIELYETERLVEKIMTGPNSKRRSLGESAVVFHENTGWQNLETSLKALQCIFEGCGHSFIPYIDDELLTLIFKTMTHSSGFVRETGFNVCSSLLKCCLDAEDGELQNPILPFGQELCGYIADGLADDSSQLRLAASVTARQFLLSLPEETRLMFYPALLPRMCLNRYYVADGVRIYSQETWRQVTGAAGKELVQHFIGPTVDYYKTATRSDNHAVREAACACIAELAGKIPASALSPYVNCLLSTLLVCFQDDSWPVRDSACLACGNFVLCFPNESRGVLDALFPLFFRNLGDVIASVRQGAATSLTNVVRAYGEEVLAPVIAQLRSGLQGMDKQSHDDDKMNDEPLVPTRYGSGKRRRDESFDGPSEFQSTGNKPFQQGSCEKTIARPPQPWELADGCAYLIGELSYLKEAVPLVIDVLPLLKEAAKCKHYTHHVVFLETICKQLPIIAKNVGKKTFSNVVEDFFETIFYALESENGLTSSAASQCVNFLATFLGQNILRAKVANYHPHYLAALESVIYIAPF